MTNFITDFNKFLKNCQNSSNLPLFFELYNNYNTKILKLKKIVIKNLHFEL